MADRSARVAESARPAQTSVGGHGGRSGTRSGSPTGRSVASRTVSLRGRVRLALIRDLAMSEWDESTLAKNMGATTADVKAFASEHATEIAEVRAALAGQLAIDTAGLWISRRQNRVAELQTLFEDADTAIADIRSRGLRDPQGLGSRRHTNLVRQALQILSATASEYEPRRGANAPGGAEGKTLHIILEGAETEELS
jgi:hypothetical protein